MARAGPTPQQAELIAQGLGALGHTHAPGLCIPPAGSPGAAGKLHPHFRALLALHRQLLAADSGPQSQRLAIAALTEILGGATSRALAPDILERLRTGEDRGEIVHHHLQPFAVGSASATSAEKATTASAAAPAFDSAAWTDVTTSRAHWVGAVAASLLHAAADPVLRACASVATLAPALAHELMPAAFADVACQPAHARLLANAVCAAAAPEAAPTEHVATLMRCVVLLRTSLASTSQEVSGAAHFWAALDSLALAESAARHGIDLSALMLLDDAYRAAAAAGRSSRSQLDTQAARRAAVLQLVLRHLDAAVPDASAGLASMLAAVPGALASALSFAPSVSLGLSDVEWRSVHGGAGAPAEHGYAPSLTHSGGAGAAQAGLPSSLEQLGAIGCHGLVFVLSGGDPSAELSLSERHSESAWRLGQWSGDVGGGGSLAPSAEPLACSAHAAIAGALGTLGSTEGSTGDERARMLGEAQQALVARLACLEREDTRNVTPLVVMLQLCSLVREGAGALQAVGVRADGTLEAGLVSRAAQRPPAPDARKRWLEWQGVKVSEQHAALSRGVTFEAIEPVLAAHLSMLRALGDTDTEQASRGPCAPQAPCVKPPRCSLPRPRSAARLAAPRGRPHCSSCERHVTPTPTDRPSCSSRPRASLGATGRCTRRRVCCGRRVSICARAA